LIELKYCTYMYLWNTGLQAEGRAARCKVELPLCPHSDRPANEQVNKSTTLATYVTTWQYLFIFSWRKTLIQNTSTRSVVASLVAWPWSAPIRTSCLGCYLNNLLINHYYHDSNVCQHKSYFCWDFLRWVHRTSFVSFYNQRVAASSQVK